ncbi:uncharacterized protein LOC124817165 [Hydra vulgaris]|uniref:uncharacterized protein LOC124817165 n=1 Tax=Hydra vulgaris TaxID=6087 RepID=UPI001F5EC522|nr:uncharacterized protein LOC124817165 [Hydra vulgaris]
MSLKELKKRLFELIDGPVALGTTTSSSLSALSSSDKDTKSSSSGFASLSTYVSVSDKHALPVAATKQRIGEADGIEEAADGVGEANDNYSTHSLDNKYMNLGSNNNLAASPDCVKETIIQHLAIITQKELGYNTSSSDCSLDNDPSAAKIVERAASNKHEESESKSETSSSSTSSDEDDESFIEDGLPAKEAAVI